MPGDLRATGDGAVALRYLDEETGAAVQAAFDLVVLSVGIGPGPDNAELASRLGLDLTPEGFFQAVDARSPLFNHPNGALSRPAPPKAPWTSRAAWPRRKPPPGRSAII